MAARQIVRKAEPVIAADPAAFAHSQQRRGRGQVGIFVARHPAAVEVVDDLRDAAAFDVAPGHIPLIGRVDAVDMAEIAGAGAGTVFGNADDMVFIERNLIPVAEPELSRSFAPPLRFAHPIEVDVGVLHAQRRAHRAARLVPEFKRDARSSGDQPVAGRIDEYGGGHFLKAARGCDRQRVNAPAGTDYVGNLHRQQQLHARFGELVVTDPLQHFGVDVLPDFIDGGNLHPAAHLRNQFVTDAGGDPVHPVADVDENRHQPRGGHAAATTGLFEQYHPGAAPGGGERGGDSGGTGSGHRDLGFGQNRQVKFGNHRDGPRSGNRNSSCRRFLSCSSRFSFPAGTRWITSALMPSSSTGMRPSAPASTSASFPESIP